MPFNPLHIQITLEEKKQIQEYLINYFGPDFTKIPEGTKLSRIKDGSRLLYIPDENGFTPISLSLLPEEKILYKESTDKSQPLRKTHGTRQILSE